MSRALPFDPIEEAGRHWRERWGDAAATPMMAATTIMRVQQVLLARLNEALEPFSLSYARYEALTLLRLSRSGALPIGKIGARLQLHPTSVTSLVDGLERDGYAERVRHPRDRRTTLVAISASGREVADAATAALNAISFGTAPLDDDDLRRTTALLRELRRAAGDFGGA